MVEPSSPRIYIQTAARDRVPYFKTPPLAAGGRSGLYVFEHRAVEAGSLPAHTFDTDILMLPVGPQAVRFQSRLNGRKVSGLIEPARFRFLARGDTLSTAWDAPVQGLFLTLTPALMSHALGDDRDSRPMELVSNIFPHQDQLLCHLVEAIATYVAGARPGGTLFEQSLLVATAVHVQMHYCAGRRSDRPATSLPRWKHARLAEYIAAHLGQEMHLKDLAAIVGLSPYYLARAYKASTGNSLWQHVLESRVTEARRLILARTELPLAVVAKDCGFDSYRQFIAAFRKFFGVLPSEYRKSLRAG
jgi:AraC family transcriptional regulator